ncbi:septal ring lytic transglycosylase RlpA family protein [Methylomonas sp. MgM2]
MFVTSFRRAKASKGTKISRSSCFLVIVAFCLVSGGASASVLSDTEKKAVVAKKAHSKSYRVKGKRYTPLSSASGYKEVGVASRYGAKKGKHTASGKRFNPSGLTAAHKTLPIQSKVRVTNLKNGRSVDVVIDDRGPFAGNRLIDLSQGAAERIGLRGLAEVKVEYLGS